MIQRESIGRIAIGHEANGICGLSNDRRRRSEQSVAMGTVRVAKRVLALLGEWQRATYDRKLLSEMDDHMLRDIGLTRCDAEREIEKPFWSR